MIEMSCMFCRVFVAIAQWECGLPEVVNWIHCRRLWWHLLVPWLAIFETYSKSIKQCQRHRKLFLWFSECQCLVLQLTVRLFSACVHTKFNIFKYTRNCEYAWHWFAQLWTHGNAREAGYICTTLYAAGTMHPYVVAGLATGEDTFWASPCTSRRYARFKPLVWVCPHQN